MMNENPIRVDQDLIDLLADDELDSEQRDLLLQNLDRDPTGWKRLAFALLESQALKRSINELQFGISSEAFDKTAKPPKPFGAGAVRHRSLMRFAMWATAAGVFLTLGFAAGNYWPSKNNTVAPQNRNVTSPIKHPIAKKLAANDRELLRQFEMASQSIGISDGNLIAFLGIRENDQSKIYPVIESQQLEHQLVNMSTLKLPKQVEQELAKAGWKINAQKQFVSVPQPNGDRKTIPIGMLNYQYVGREMF